jgi:hypothetical protein
MDSQVSEDRRAALSAAVAYAAMFGEPFAEAQVLRIAGRFLGWLAEPASVLRIRVSPFTFSLTTPGKYRPTTFTQLEGGGMAVTMQDNEYVTLSLDAVDAAGNPTADSGVTWAADDTALATLVPSADGTQVNVGAAGGLGTVNITSTDAAGNVSPADPITITSGPATTLGITAGTPAVIPASGVPVPAGVSAPSGS